MGRIDPANIAGVGLDDGNPPALPSDEARALLCLFAAPEREACMPGTLGTLILSVPNGQNLYVTSGATPFAHLVAGR